MAGDWIKMRMDLPEDPAVIGIAQATGLDEDTVVGKLHRVWSWANRQTIDGNARTVTSSWLDRYVGVTGFSQAMVDVGWLTCKLGGDDGISLPEFERHNSQSAKQRALTARRMSKMRNAAGVTVPSPEKRREREEKSKGETPLQTPFRLPTCLQTLAFRKAWDEWITYRVKAKPETLARQLKRLAKMGEARAIAAIQHTIEKGWTGLREPEPEPGQKPAFTSRGLDLG